MEEDAEHRHEVTEVALAHFVGNEVEAAYARSDLFEWRRLMDDSAAYLYKPGEEVVACHLVDPARTGATHRKATTAR